MAVSVRDYCSGVLNREARTLTYYGDALLVPNVLGQKVRQKFECDYDPEKDELTGFRVDAAFK